MIYRFFEIDGGGRIAATDYNLHPISRREVTPKSEFWKTNRCIKKLCATPSSPACTGLVGRLTEASATRHGRLARGYLVDGRVTYASGITDAAALLRIAAETALKRANLHMFAEIAALLDGLAVVHRGAERGGNCRQEGNPIETLHPRRAYRHYHARRCQRRLVRLHRPVGTGTINGRAVLDVARAALQPPGPSP